MEVCNPVPSDTQGKETRAKAPKQYIWSPDSKEDFLNTIKTDEFQGKLEKCFELDRSDPNNLVEHITEVLTTAAEKCKIKYVKQKHHKDPPWFDKTCRDLKEKIKSFGEKKSERARKRRFKS